MRMKNTKMITKIFIYLIVAGIVLLVVRGLYTILENFDQEYVTLPYDPRLAWLTERGTRNMSYDLRGDPAPNPIRPYIWNNSSIAAREARKNVVQHQIRLPFEKFKKYSEGLTISDEKTIEKGYLAGWPAVDDTTSGWIDPTVLDDANTRWSDYAIAF